MTSNKNTIVFLHGRTANKNYLEKTLPGFGLPYFSFDAPWAADPKGFAWFERDGDGRADKKCWPHRLNT
jgi:hypothetical protein